MKKLNDQIIIGVDHGYGNIKTANHCFRTGILGYDSEPLFTGDMLTYNGRYYLIGEGHKEFIAEKIKDEDYYLLTLVAIAKELKEAELTEASIVLAAGLPLTWTSGQKKEFAAYLGKNKEVDFNYKKVDYHITIDDVRIYPQGYAAIAEFASTMKGVNLVADIGNGTMNVLYMVNGRPQSGKMYTEKFGTHQCTLAIREMFMQKTQREINDAIIEEVLCTGTAAIPAADIKLIRMIAKEYVDGIFRRLREHGYDEGTINDYAFCYNPSIKTVLIDGNVLSLGHHVFAFCNRLERVVFGNGVKTVNTWLCGGCPALKEVIFSNTIEYIGNNAISGNHQLYEVSFPDSMTNMSQVMNCNKLERIKFSKNTKELSFNSVLYCENLKTIEVAKDTIISRDAVRGCGEFEIRTFD